MDGTPESAQRLIQLAEYSVSCGNHLQAALFFDAASSISGISASVQAKTLYNCALQLYYDSDEEQHEASIANLTRAIAKLRQASFLLQAQPSFFNLSMHIANLASRIYAHLGDFRTAGILIDRAISKLPLASSSATISDKQIRAWWIYFRGRAVTIALSSPQGLQRAEHIAQETVDECAAVNDYIPAAGFLLSVVQIKLAISSSRHVDIISALERVNVFLTNVPDHSDDQSVYVDKHLLVFCLHLLQGLALLRYGLVSPAHEHTLPKLRDAYNTLRRLQKQSGTAGVWAWLPYKVGSAVAFFIMTCICRGSIESDQAPAYALSALKRLNVKPTDIDTITPEGISIEGISKEASVLLIILLLESLVRSYYVSLDLRAAVAPLEAILALAFDDPKSKQIVSAADADRSDVEIMGPVVDSSLPYHERVSRCSALLLAAEYYCLRGAIDEAETATIHFQTILENPLINPDITNNEQRSDIWQMAATHLSLLVGEKRINGFVHNICKDDLQDINQPHSVTTPQSDQFFNQQMLAAAWFAMGIFYMRQSDVVESKRFLEIAVRSSKDSSTQNNQIAACSLAILTCILMTHESIEPKALQMSTEAVMLAQEVNDPVGMVRTARQHRKLVIRQGLSDVDQSSADAKVKEVDKILEDKLRGTTSIFSDDCW